VPDLLPLLHLLPDLHSGHAGRDLGHADEDDGQPADARVGCVDEEDLPGGDCGEEGLAVVG